MVLSGHLWVEVHSKWFWFFVFIVSLWAILYGFAFTRLSKVSSDNFMMKLVSSLHQNLLLVECILSLPTASCQEVQALLVVSLEVGLAFACVDSRVTFVSWFKVTRWLARSVINLKLTLAVSNACGRASHFARRLVGSVHSWLCLCIPVVVVNHRNWALVPWMASSHFIVTHIGYLAVCIDHCTVAHLMIMIIHS